MEQTKRLVMKEKDTSFITNEKYLNVDNWWEDDVDQVSKSKALKYHASELNRAKSEPYVNMTEVPMTKKKKSVGRIEENKMMSTTQVDETLLFHSSSL
jgi:hypothetical protein